MFFPPGLFGKASQVQMRGLCAHVQTLRTLFPMALNSRVFHELMICTCVFSLLPSPLSMNIVFIFHSDVNKTAVTLSRVLFVCCYHSLVELTVLKAKTSTSVSTPVPTPYLLLACLRVSGTLPVDRRAVRTFRTEQEGLKGHCGLWNFTTSVHLSLFLADTVSTSANF